MNTWLVSTQTGSNANGGTSPTVIATGTDGIVSSAGGTTKITSISATWTSALVGQGIYASSSTILRLISAVQVVQSVATAVTTNTLTTLTSAGLFNSTMLGCAVSGPGIAAGTYISAYTNSSSMTLSAAAGAGAGSGALVIGPLATTTGTTAFTAATAQTWNVGGMLATVNRAMVTASGVKNCYSAGDDIYLGAGTYAETVANALSGTSGHPISVIGDVDGAQTGQPGQVTLSAYTSGNTSAPSSTVLLALAATTNLNFSLITFIGGSGIVISSTAAAAAANYTFTDCVVNGINVTNANAMSFISSTTGLALGLTIDRCVVFANLSHAAINISAATTASGAADFDLLCVIRNSLLVGGPGVSLSASGTAAFSPGGVRAYGCTILAGGAAFSTATATHISTTIPCEVHNNLMMGEISAATAGQITGSYNVIYAGVPEANYTYGTGDISNTSSGTGTYAAPLVELGQSWKWAGILRQFLAPDDGSPLFGKGSATFTGNYPTVDWANRPRPSGGGSADATPGYMERHDFSKQNTTTYPTGQTSSGEMVGPGDTDIWVPVDAVATVLAIDLYQGSGYTGTTYATATILTQNEIGVATQTETCSSATGSWQTLTFSSITPTKQGYIKIRITSYDTAGTGTLFFGALTAT